MTITWPTRSSPPRCSGPAQPAASTASAAAVSRQREARAGDAGAPLKVERCIAVSIVVVLPGYTVLGSGEIDACAHGAGPLVARNDVHGATLRRLHDPFDLDAIIGDVVVRPE